MLSDWYTIIIQHHTYYLLFQAGKYCVEINLWFEIVACRIASEMIISIKYKLRMFEITIDGSTNLFCDNEAVYIMFTCSESQLRRKHQ